MQKISAYTLMEVTVAMLLSAICITVCYSAYGIINQYYTSFQQKNQTADIALSLKHAMQQDFSKGDYVIKQADGIEISTDSTKIGYFFVPNAILRKLNESHTDTFKLSTGEIDYQFNGKAVVDLDTVDEVSFKLVLDKNNQVPLHLKKVYSSANLFQ